MRLVVDLQGAQSATHDRDVGRYSRSLILAMAAEAGPHDVVIALNGGFAAASAELRDAFAPYLPPDHVQVWYGPGSQTAEREVDAPHRRAAERIRAAFLATLKPDLLLVASTFDGFHNDIVTTYPSDIRPPLTVSLCYNPTPFLQWKTYLANPAIRHFYFGALLQLQHSDGLLAISTFSKEQMIAELGIPGERISNIMAGVSPQFCPPSDNDPPLAGVLARYGLKSGYVFCIGAVGQRKNLHRLIKAYGRLSPALRRNHPLVATAWDDARLLPSLRNAAIDAGLAEDELRLITGLVPDNDLPALYRGSALTVSPSLRESFGLSVAEAMACDSAVICSNTSSLPEVIGREDATFDPNYPESIAERMHAVLEWPEFRDELIRYNRRRAGLFTWAATARRAWDALERLAPAPSFRFAPIIRRRRKLTLIIVAPLSGDTVSLFQLLVQLSACYRIVLVSGDSTPTDVNPTNSFPVQRPESILGTAPDRLILIPGDDPFHTALTLQLSFAFAAIVIAGSRPITDVLSDGVGEHFADLLTGCLLDHYGWQGAVAAREGIPGLSERYPLEPMLRARSVALLKLAPNALTEDLIEQAYAAHPRAEAEACAADLASIEPGSPEIARALATTFTEELPRGLFLDVTTLAVFDAGTGIQRVVKEITRQLGRAHDVAARVELVHSDGGVVRLARNFGRTLYGVPDVSPATPTAVFRPGDVFVNLDLSYHDLPSVMRTLHSIRSNAGRAVIVIYDLLPILMPQHFPETVQNAFPLWLSLVASHADALLTISRTVADELIVWLNCNRPSRGRPLDIGWFHLGSDFIPVAAPIPAPERPELLMVGTVEPRKGHNEALDAMEQLWRSGANVGLLIAGRAGWHTEALQTRLQTHPEAGQRLCWLTSADDKQVAALYRRSSALLMASEGEGFGLPIVEAARAGLPVIARDIPVFREICADGALLYAPGKLAETIQHWLTCRADTRVLNPAKIRTITWFEASRRLAQIVLDDDWYFRWQ